MKKISSSSCSAGRLVEHVALQIRCSNRKHLSNVIERDLVTKVTALHFSDSLRDVLERRQWLFEKNEELRQQGGFNSAPTECCRAADGKTDEVFVVGFLVRAKKVMMHTQPLETRHCVMMVIIHTVYTSGPQ